MKISANQLNAHLKKSLLPCYLVTGDEPLLVQEALDQIRAAARAQGFGSRELFITTTGFDWTDLRNASITDDGKTLYPVNDGIPVLLEGESVVLDQLQGSS